MLVLVGDDEAVQTLALKLGANQGQVLAPEARIGMVVEGLVHGGI